jgi:peptidoglycan/LPS O-acetylase OafA/YrhL
MATVPSLIVISCVRGHHAPVTPTPTATPAPAAVAPTAPTTPAAGRDRYLDALRAAAIVRVVIFHMFGVAWLSYAYPAMGVMFALGGSLMARSIQRSARQAVTSRIRRLLPALWVLGAVMVPVMRWHGWPGQGDRLDLLLWVVPLADPPGSAWATEATEVLWYLVTYLWLVLLSPLAWRAYRQWPVPTLLAPLAVLVALVTTDGRLGPVELAGRVGDVVTDVATFGACWVLGFAHRTGALRRVNRPLLLALAADCLVAGAAWALTHPADDAGYDLNDIPLAQALYSLGFVLIVLRAGPPMGWLARIRPLDRLVTLLNSRAVTIYLWHNVAIAVSFPVGDLLGVWRLGQAVEIGYFAIALLGLAVVVLAVGWVEDLSAGRRPRLLGVCRRAGVPGSGGRR